MNNEQKQRALQILRRFEQADPMTRQVDNAAVDMAALLQELIDAPEPEPVGYTNETELDYVRTYEAFPVRGAFWPTCDDDANIALYTAPPAPSVPDADLVRDAERYRWLRNWTRVACGIDSKPAFILPHVPIPTVPDQNIMRGSLAQHMDNAIDAAIEREKKGGQQ